MDVKYNPPTNLVKAPFCGLWFEKTESGEFRIYIQINDEAESPYWVRLGDLYEAGFEKMQAAEETWHEVFWYIDEYKKKYESRMHKE